MEQARRPIQITGCADFGEPAVKDHEKRELVNRLTKIAREYAHTQQLRERIAHELLSSIESDSSFAAQAAAWRSLVEWLCTAEDTADSHARQCYAIDLVEGNAFEDWYDEAAGRKSGTNAPPEDVLRVLRPYLFDKVQP